MMKSSLALSAVGQRTQVGNAQSVVLITETGISQTDQSNKPNECNARITGAGKVKTNYGYNFMSNEQNQSDTKANPVDTLVTLSVPDAFNVLKKAMQDDPEYAWSWHCNLAMSFYDEIETCESNDAHVICNHAASRFMRLCFDIDTAKNKNFTAM